MASGSLTALGTQVQGLSANTLNVAGASTLSGQITVGSVLARSGEIRLRSGTRLIDEVYAGSVTFANTTNGARLTLLVAQPDAKYQVVVTPEFNPVAYGGVWVTGLSATTFDIRMASNSDSATMVFNWLAYRGSGSSADA